MLSCERLESVDSTQRELQRRLGSLSGPAAVWTTCQTSGVASHGRAWRDSPDGFAWSAAWPAASADAQTAAWPARLSLMTLNVLEDLYPAARQRLGLKWPNDVIVDGGKLCGVLVSQHCVAGTYWLIAGIGINLSWPAAPAIDRPVADLQSLGITADPKELAHRLCQAISLLWASPSDSQWPAEFSRRDVFLASQVAVVHPHTGKTLLAGLNQGIDREGRLLLSAEGQLVPVQIGELSLRSMEQAA
jgi:BirA family transcriptional regulator, biotin operon repressor / biotin---[acetyl-CoA-carboxylase] ligase